jgi:aryl-alcohol dehydrogenase-like predicted oxidoreductase
VERRALGGSALKVSALSLGSWRTFETIPWEQGLAVMRAAREAGIDFLDDARYDDRTGSAPIPTGYSEVVFGELFRAARWRRDEVIVANKLWWEWWPEQSAAEELDHSLLRMGLDHVDLVYAERPPDGLEVEQVVDEVARLLQAGKARAWGVLNWRAGLLAEAAEAAARRGVPPPCAAQLVYSIAQPEAVEDAGLADALDAAGASVVASAALAGGALTGKYAHGVGGRLSDELDAPRWQRPLALGERLESFAHDLDTTSARLAIAFALASPRIASVLFGATTQAQVTENAGAVELLDRLDDGDLERLRSLASGDV